MNLILAKWYAAHSAVRRLWAISEAQGLRVIVMLEPTNDGDDLYPAWLANGQRWAHELQSRLGEPVRLELMDQPYPGEDAVTELSWRDASLPA
jgi:hypothetical protein